MRRYHDGVTFERKHLTWGLFIVSDGKSMTIKVGSVAAGRGSIGAVDENSP